MKIASFAAAAITFASTWNGRSSASRLFASLSPIDTQTSVTTQSAPRAATSGSSLTSIVAPSALAQPSKAGDGENAGGEAIRSAKPNRAAACTHEVATLLASPIQAIMRPLIGPFSSSKVITSAITWQGCDRQVRPLITGTLACAAISVSVSCGPVRSMIAST